MGSENAHHAGSPDTEATSVNTRPVSGPRRRGRRPVPLPGRLEAVHGGYVAVLAAAPLSTETRRTYASKARQYLAWLEAADVDGDPLADPAARDRAVRDWRTHLLTVAKHAPATVNSALAAVDDFYSRRGVGPAAAKRADLPATAPRALDKRAQLRWLRAVEAHPSPRDRALAGILFYAGARIAETVRLDTGDVRVSARKGVVRIHGKGDRIRGVPLHPKLGPTSTAGQKHVRTGPGPRRTSPCSSTTAAGAFPCAAPVTSSPASPRPPASTATLRRMSCGTFSLLKEVSEIE